MFKFFYISNFALVIAQVSEGLCNKIDQSNGKQHILMITVAKKKLDLVA